MPKRLMVMKVGENLVPATEADKEILAPYRSGRAFAVDLVEQSDRSLQHHKLYWAGLISLLQEYWECESGYVSSYDKKVMNGMLTFVKSQGHNAEALTEIVRLYLQDKARRTREKISTEQTQASKQQISDWIKEQIGYYDIVVTPTGIQKQLKSINFQSMKQEEFSVFYKQAFTVAWNYIFSKNQFASQEEAENVAMQMADIG